MKKGNRILIILGITLLIAASVFYFLPKSDLEESISDPNNLESFISLEFIEDLIDTEYIRYNNDTTYNESHEIKMKYSKSSPLVDCSKDWVIAPGCTYLMVSIMKKTTEEIEKDKQGLIDYVNSGYRADFIDIGDFSTEFEVRNKDRSTGEIKDIQFSIVFLKNNVWVWVNSNGPDSNADIVEKVARDIESKI